MRRFEIVCGGTSLRGASMAAKTIQMNVQGRSRNVNLKIEDITRTMLRNLPDVLLDLLEVAAYVYCADQRVSRGSDKLTDWGRDWRRDLHFTIPVRLRERWESPEVKTALAETLGFLSDDTYSFSFVTSTKPLAERELYFPQFVEGAFEPDEIALFSGGIDSFAGAVESIVRNGKKLALVGHHSAVKVFNVQKALIEELKQAGFARQLFYVPINVTNTGVAAHEYTQRTRSFLFACLGLVVARMFGKDHLTFFENGVVSINLPISGDVLGARATRTTHPRVLRGFESIFSALLDCPITIQSPLQWQTKTEVVRKIAENGFPHLLSRTVSCTRPRKWTTQQRHCGACSQCIDRRFAVLAAGLEKHDPGNDYMIDLLTGDRSSDQSLHTAISYVRLAQKLTATSKERFIADHSEIASALAYFPGLTPDCARDQLHDLFRRHAADVLSVVSNGMTKHSNALVRDELPAGALLSLCSNRSRIETQPATDYDQQVKAFLDRLTLQPIEFAVDEVAKCILFKGNFHLDGKNYDLVSALLENFRKGKRPGAEIAYLPAPTLASQLNITEAALRQQVTRLRQSVATRLAVDLGIPLGTNDFIENRERAGYRLNPAVREVAPADL